MQYSAVSLLTILAEHYNILDPCEEIEPAAAKAVIWRIYERMLLPILGLLIGVLGLLWGADRFVAGSAGAARNFGISPLIIGLTVVSIGTSAPEVLVSVNAALSNAAELAVGNALGSNMANIGLVLGVTLLIAPTPVQKHLLSQEACSAFTGHCNRRIDSL